MTQISSVLLKQMLKKKDTEEEEEIATLPPRLHREVNGNDINRDERDANFQRHDRKSL